ncbi:MAG TPA: sigma 54-interacting transcriptional regulator [Polyangiaceae bacterium]|nr:sigma 54-interacting transcriptional regulator [Polyangiaceae bacterium]
MKASPDRHGSPALPSRYEALSRLGQGGAGEVWAVRDRYTDRRYALKLLSRDANEGASASLVKEAVALSGLEGLGVPRVISFGTLPDNSRLYMLRELVEGQSLHELIEIGEDARACLSGLALAAEKLTRVHRAGLLHGDIKPANIIVSIEENDANLVDLGLAEPFRDRGTAARGLTPKYAAPELLAGGALTVRAEIYALGVTLGDIIDASGARQSLGEREFEQLAQVRQRATARDPQSRYPSADEFGAALRGSARLRDSTVSLDGAALWPITGIDAVATRLLRLALDALPGSLLAVVGPLGAGKSVLLTRLAWSLGVEGQPLVWLDDGLVDNPTAVASEVAALPDDPEAILIVDDFDRMSADDRLRVNAVRTRGVRVIVASALPPAEPALAPERVFEVPPLAETVASELVLRAVPSLTPKVVKRLLDVSGSRPGPLKRLIQRMAAAAVVSEQDVEALLGSPNRGSISPDSPLGELQDLLDRGRFSEAQALMDAGIDVDPVGLAIARSRLSLGLGDAQKARDVLIGVQTLAESRRDSERGRAWRLWLARAEVGLRRPEAALELLDELVAMPGPLGAEAGVNRGLALFHLGKVDAAKQCLEQGREAARRIGASRVEALACLCIGRVHLHTEQNDAAREAFEQALVAAERASDASALTTAQSQIAVLLRLRGDVAGAIKHFEAAIDAGRRSGRLSSVRLSLANLANTDLYLGRLERAQASIDELERQRDTLGDFGRAQLLGLKADLLANTGQVSLAAASYRECAQAFTTLGFGAHAAEARLSAVLLTPLEGSVDLEALAHEIQLSREQIGDSPIHLPLYNLAQARLDRIAKNDSAARANLAQALSEARDTKQPEWIWRALEASADLAAAEGQTQRAQQERRAAVRILEEIAARLPQDLREVYWNDERRNRLRAALVGERPAPERDLALGRTVHSGNGNHALALSDTTRTPLERRLARILEINSELLAEFDLERLTVRVIEYALELLNAERGYVLLRQPDGSLSVHTSRDFRGDVARAEFSRSIAQRVMVSRKPVVSLDASRDVSLQSFASVHQLALQAVACVPIRGRSAQLIGALYLETRLTPGNEFERELPTLGAFADQVGLAIETAHLVTENVNRAKELADTNAQLESAQERLRELLGARTQKLKVARRKLRDAQDTLYGHFGYQGLVGTSAAMRRLYSLIDRVKDTDVPVLVSGESGTGKEVVSRAVHRASERNNEPFLGINCGAIPEHLLESELFGHVRGAFTGADRERKGLLREAGGGTVLLDEIGEMPHKMQASLLRVLQERKVRPVGATAEIDIECRFIFATHRNLRQMVDDGRFREDLYYRIVVVELTLPSLRDHVEDIAPLVDYFLGLFAARYKREKKTLTRAALRRLSSYEWPGNVRQLEHVLLNAWVLSDQAEIDVEDLDLPDNQSRDRSHPPSHAPDSEEVETPVAAAPEQRPPARQTLSSHLNDEKARIAEALAACNWNRVRAAEMLGMPRRTFYRRLKQYQLQ